MTYGSGVTVASPFPETVALVRAALADEGFGVLTEIDVRSTMKAKLDADMEDYLILGACNPPLAHRALELDREIGLLLPCNVVVRSVPEGTRVDVLDPHVMVTLTGIPELKPVADDAAARLERAVASLAKP